MRLLPISLLLIILIGCSTQLDENIRTSHLNRAYLEEEGKITSNIRRNAQLLMPGRDRGDNYFKIIDFCKTEGDSSWQVLVLNAETEEQMWLLKVYDNNEPIEIVREFKMVPPRQAVGLALNSFRMVASNIWRGNNRPSEIDFLISKFEYFSGGRFLMVHDGTDGGTWGLGTNPDGTIDPKRILYPSIE